MLRHTLHGQGNALFAGIHAQHLDAHDVAHLEQLARVLDEFIADLGHMDEAVLMHAEIDKGTEVDDIAHGAGQLHAGLEVVQPHDIAAQQGLGQAVADIAARLAELGHNVVQGRLAHAQQRTEGPGALGLNGAGQPRQPVGADLSGRVAAGVQQRLGGRVAFRVDGGRIQTVLGLGQPQEARALLIRLGAEALDLFQPRGR